MVELKLDILALCFANRNHVNGLGGSGRRDLCFSKEQNILDHNQEFGLVSESSVRALEVGF